MKVRPKVKRVVGLTGTPSSNGLMDLFAEYKVLDMGERLGRFISQYRVEYFVPDQTNGPIVYSYRLRKGADKKLDALGVNYGKLDPDQSIEDWNAGRLEAGSGIRNGRGTAYYYSRSD